MAMYSTNFGIDSHLRTTTICALTVADGELKTRTFKDNPYAEMAEWMASFPPPSYGVYESGCTGFVPARMLACGDVLVEPVASSKLPSSADSRSKKNDRRDAERLARLALAGELSPVWVPDERAEGLRGIELGDPGSQAAYLAALAAAEAAETAYDELAGKAAAIAADSEPGPVIDALVCVEPCQDNGQGFCRLF